MDVLYWAEAAEPLPVFHPTYTPQPQVVARTEFATARRVDLPHILSPVPVKCYNIPSVIAMWAMNKEEEELRELEKKGEELRELEKGAEELRELEKKGEELRELEKKNVGELRELEKKVGSYAKPARNRMRYVGTLHSKCSLDLAQYDPWSSRLRPRPGRMKSSRSNEMQRC